MPSGKTTLKVLNVVSEMVPFIATGGMGQVAGVLTKTIARNYPDIDMRVILPLYSQFRDRFEPQMKFVGETEVQLAWRNLYCGISQLDMDGVTYYFVDNRHYFDRESAYGHFDDGERYAFFCKAVFSVMDVADFYPDVIHAHDWQTALVPVFLKTHFSNMYGKIKTLFTMHNMEYQGQYRPDIYNDIFDLLDQNANLVNYDGCINLMKGAIICADKLTTVSPTYASEIQVSGGYKLEPIIRENSYKLTGIINGIDTGTFDPATDPLLEKNYTANDLDGKAVNKEKLQTLFNLPIQPDTMLICVVSRLSSHKGIDLITYIMEEMLGMDIQFMLLGTGEHAYELFFEEKAMQHPHKVAINIAYNPEIACKIFAGADVLLMPSRSEPCGLSQMIACRYGTIPIVRKTGGLADTIHDCRNGNGNGFVFEDYNADALLHTVSMALDLYSNRRDDWKNLMREAMLCDFGWELSARAYTDLYKELAHK